MITLQYAACICHLAACLTGIQEVSDAANLLLVQVGACCYHGMPCIIAC